MQADFVLIHLQLSVKLAWLDILKEETWRYDKPRGFVLLSSPAQHFPTLSCRTVRYILERNLLLATMREWGDGVEHLGTDKDVHILAHRIEW